MGCCAFWGGHGTASAAGGVLEELGAEGSMAMGMILSAIGLIVAATIGIMLVNWGLRKQYTVYTKVSAKGEDKTLGGVLPKENQKPIGFSKTTSVGINGLILQFSFIMVCMWTGSKVIALCGMILPAFNKIPLLVHGMIGAVIVRFVMHLLKAESYMDTASVSTISVFTLDVIIISAIATLKLSMFSGAVPTGLALLRCVDPEGKSSVPDAQGVSSTVFTPVSGVMPALLPTLILSSTASVVGVASILVAVPLIGGIILHKQIAPRS